MTILGLHHSASRCRDSALMRAFCKVVPGLPLIHTLEIHVTKTGRATATLF